MNPIRKIKDYFVLPESGALYGGRVNSLIILVSAVAAGTLSTGMSVEYLREGKVDVLALKCTSLTAICLQESVAKTLVLNSYRRDLSKNCNWVMKLPAGALNLIAITLLWTALYKKDESNYASGEDSGEELKAVIGMVAGVVLMGVSIYIFSRNIFFKWESLPPTSREPA